jgi:hypothetical protein
VTTGLLSFVLSAALAGESLSVTALPPAEQGRARAQIELQDLTHQQAISGATPSATVRAIVGQGQAAVGKITPLYTSDEPVYTVMAFDQSGSFKRHWAAAFDLAEGFAAALPAGKHSVEVTTLGVQFIRQGVVTDGPGLTALLTKVEAQGSGQSATRLKGFVRDAIDLAAAGQPLASGGARQVIVFTDGGDESAAYDVAEIVAYARERGVIVHTVAHYQGAKVSPERLDELRQLSEGTGGRGVQVDGAAQAKAAVQQLATLATRLYWVDLSFCGLNAATPHFDDKLTIELMSGGKRLAWSDPTPFRQNASGAGVTACAGCEAGCPAGQVCDGGACKADPNAKAPAATATKDSPWWPWLLALLAALGLGGLLAWLLASRRREREAPAQVAQTSAPVPPPSPPVVVAAAPAAEPGSTAGWRDPFATFPETQLHVVGQQPSVEPILRVHKSPLKIGGSREAGVDLVLNLPQVSGHHATVQVYPAGAVFVTDHGSTNGTYVGGRRLASGERVELLPGDILSLSQQLHLRLVQPSRMPTVSPSQPTAPPVAPPAAPPPSSPVHKQTIIAPVKPPRGDR